MTIPSQQLADWLNAKEDEHLEFKEAKNNFHFEKLVKYCAALANEGTSSIKGPPARLGGFQRARRKLTQFDAIPDAIDRPGANEEIHEHQQLTWSLETPSPGAKVGSAAASIAM